MNGIELVLFGELKEYEGSWSKITTLSSKTQISEFNLFIEDHLKNNRTTHILFWDSTLGIPDEKTITSLSQTNIDLYHAGLKLGMQGLPKTMDYVMPTWTLNCDPPTEINATSWRLSFRACLIRSDVFRMIGLLDDRFTCLDAASLEWGHRCIQNGVFMRFHSNLITRTQEVPKQLPIEDELRFIACRFSKTWLRWALYRMLCNKELSWSKLLKYWAKFKLVKKNGVHRTYLNDTIKKQRTENLKVSVLIPTIDRYRYLFPLLTSLKDQSYPIYEVIVIDQTPQSFRQLDYEANYPEIPLRVMYQDEAGQCSSRNAGLNIASGDVVLFIDDDDEVETNLIEKHIQALENSQADASCGVADEVDAGELPPDFQLQRISDVFPTNNTLLKRSALSQSGFFDLAYNRGQRADGDLGMRLYLSGALLVLQPDIHVLHHHAPMGGLRTHKARVITYASSRKHIRQRRLLSITEHYLALRYFNERQCHEAICLNIASTFSYHGSKFKKLIKGLYSTLMLWDSVQTSRKRQHEARELLKTFPQIPKG